MTATIDAAIHALADAASLLAASTVAAAALETPPATTGHATNICHEAPL